MALLQYPIIIERSMMVCRHPQHVAFLNHDAIQVWFRGDASSRVTIATAQIGPRRNIFCEQSYNNDVIR